MTAYYIIVVMCIISAHFYHAKPFIIYTINIVVFTPFTSSYPCIFVVMSC